MARSNSDRAKRASGRRALEDVRAGRLSAFHFRRHTLQVVVDLQRRANDVVVRLLRRERAALVRTEREERASRECEAENRRLQQEQRAAEAERTARAEADERRVALRLPQGDDGPRIRATRKGDAPGHHAACHSTTAVR